MISDIEKLIHNNVEGFLEETAKEFDIPMAKLKENWKAHLGTAGTAGTAGTVGTVGTVGNAGNAGNGDTLPKKKTAKKSSLYQNFFVQKRAELVKTNPDLQFGDLSSQISKLWNSMSKDEQKSFTAGTAPPPVARKEFNFESLNAKNMPELRKLCEEKGLRRTGNKLMLIHNLLGINTAAAVPAMPVEEVKKTTMVVVASDETEDVEVVVAKNMKRADIEEEVALGFSDDEQDFDFEEGSNYSVNLEEDD